MNLHVRLASSALDEQRDSRRVAGVLVQDISSRCLELACKYLHHKLRYMSTLEGTDIPGACVRAAAAEVCRRSNLLTSAAAAALTEFFIPPEDALELLIVANYLDI